jgi:hypothetical protein
MSKAKKVKQVRLKPFEKLLTVMISGKPVARDEIETLLGNEIYMYRLSTYIWHIKTHANGIVKAIKDGRKVTAYQLMNVADVKKYMDRLGITNSGFSPKTTVQSLDEIKTAEVKVPVTKAPVAEELEIIEIEVQDAE